MTAPICDLVRRYAEKHTVRAHMPGHKGISPAKCGFEAAYLYDITEIKGADFMFESTGVIRESERNASKLFGTAGTIYSAAGSTACIQAMLGTVCRPGDTVAAARNCHTAFINACAMLDLKADWIYPDNTDSFISGDYSPDSVERVLKNSKAKCVYITSPDYLGHMNDIRGIAEVCRRYDVKLLSDNAHGAYTAFLSPSLHPIALGADMCCDSAHKTLPVLTGGAYLHASESGLAERAKKVMSMFCSTSPSYLIMQSLDLCNVYLSGDFSCDLGDTCRMIAQIKENLREKWSIPECEPLKIVIYAPSSGYNGNELADILRTYGIECEYSDRYHVVLMLSVSNTSGELCRIERSLMDIPQKEALASEKAQRISPLEKAMDIRSAVFSENESIPADEIEKAVGRICGRTVSCCPPGIAAAVPGEVITEEIADIVIKYGLPGINAVRSSQ